MINFFTDMPANPFLLNGLLAGLLAGMACGIVGPYVTTKRIVFLTGAIAHLAVGGIGAAVFLRHAWPDTFAWFTPYVGAAVAAVIGAIIIGLIQHAAHEQLDTLIGATWAVGMSIGLLLIKYTPGYHVELMSYLFGNLSIVPRAQVWTMLALVALILCIVLLMHKKFMAVCIDEQQAALQGANVLLTNLIMLVLVALTVVVVIRVVGLILVLALLTLPAATAGHYMRRLPGLIGLSLLLCMLLSTLPRIAVYGTRISPESAIVLAAGAVYLLSAAARRMRRYGSISPA
jgi:zinc transport system permease protein